MKNIRLDDVEEPKIIEGTQLLPFEPRHTGQALLLFQTPPEMVDRLNKIYDELMPKGKLQNMNSRLIGKVSDAYSLYRNDENPEAENHNFLPDDIHEWIKDRIHQYLNSVLGTAYLGIKTSTSWINDMKAYEYNPIHMHHGTEGPMKPPIDSLCWKVGLIGLMCLKMPKDMGPEVTNYESPDMQRNGFIEFVVNGIRQFSPQSQLIKMTPGTFIVHPYDMLHTVYPHFNENETRRTMPTNIDVYF